MLILKLLGRLALALIMQFPASVPARLHVIVFFLGRLGWDEDGSLAVDLTSDLSAYRRPPSYTPTQTRDVQKVRQHMYKAK